MALPPITIKFEGDPHTYAKKSFNHIYDINSDICATEAVCFVNEWANQFYIYKKRKTRPKMGGYHVEEGLYLLDVPEGSKLVIGMEHMQLYPLEEIAVEYRIGVTGQFRYAVEFVGTEGKDRLILITRFILAKSTNVITFTRQADIIPTDWSVKPIIPVE